MPRKKYCTYFQQGYNYSLNAVNFLMLIIMMTSTRWTYQMYTFSTSLTSLALATRKLRASSFWCLLQDENNESYSSISPWQIKMFEFEE